MFPYDRWEEWSDIKFFTENHTEKTAAENKLIH